MGFLGHPLGRRGSHSGSAPRDAIACATGLPSYPGEFSRVPLDNEGRNSGGALGFLRGPLVFRGYLKFYRVLQGHIMIPKAAAGFLGVLRGSVSFLFSNSLKRFKFPTAPCKIFRMAMGSPLIPSDCWNSFGFRKSSGRSLETPPWGTFEFVGLPQASERFLRISPHSFAFSQVSDRIPRGFRRIPSDAVGSFVSL